MKNEENSDIDSNVDEKADAKSVNISMSSKGSKGSKRSDSRQNRFTDSFNSNSNEPNLLSSLIEEDELILKKKESNKYNIKLNLQAMSKEDKKDLSVTQEELELLENKNLFADF